MFLAFYRAEFEFVFLFEPRVLSRMRIQAMVMISDDNVISSSHISAHEGAQFPTERPHSNA